MLAGSICEPAAEGEAISIGATERSGVMSMRAEAGVSGEAVSIGVDTRSVPRTGEALGDTAAAWKLA